MDKNFKLIFWVVYAIALFTATCLATACSTRFLPPAPDFGTKVLQTLGALALVALCIERAAEVILTPVRGVEGRQLDHKMEEAAKKQEELENESKDLAQKIISLSDPSEVTRLTDQRRTLQLQLDVAKTAHLDAIKEHDEQAARTFVWAMLIALVIGLFAAGAGVRVLGPVFSVDPVAAREPVSLPSAQALINAALIVSNAAVQIAGTSSQLNNASALLVQSAGTGAIAPGVAIQISNYSGSALAQGRAAAASVEPVFSILAAPGGPIVLGAAQHQWLAWLDIFLTAVILAGGSDGVHRIFSLYNSFMASNTPPQKN